MRENTENKGDRERGKEKQRERMMRRNTLCLNVCLSVRYEFACLLACGFSMDSGDSMCTVHLRHDTETYSQMEIVTSAPFSGETQFSVH